MQLSLMQLYLIQLSLKRLTNLIDIYNKNNMRSVGIVGAGISALSCSSQLINQLANLEIRIFEKAKGLGGRAATRRVMDYTFDHGANYLTMDSLNEAQKVLVKQILERVDPLKESVLIPCNHDL